MKKYKQLMLVILAFILTVACVLLIDSTTVIGAMAGSFLATVGAFTALDLKAIVKTTKSMPTGKYKEANKFKYYIGIILLTLLFGLTLYKQSITGLNLELSYGLLGPGTVGIITIIISGMKLNKSATIDGPPLTGVN